MDVCPDPAEGLSLPRQKDFLGFSYGFWPGRSQHDALDALTAAIERKKVNWVLDADISDFFTGLDQSWLAKFLEHRIADKRVLRLIQKWLRAGVIEDGEWTARRRATAQGASVSPLLSNVYLHYVFDLWADQWRTRHARGDVILVRFADDYVAGFDHREDAERFLADLRERFAKFGLELNAEKTRLIEFGRFAARDRQAVGSASLRRSSSWASRTSAGRTGSRGGSSSSGSRARSGCAPSCTRSRPRWRRRMHHPIPEQGRWLARVLAGHYNYYAVPDNSRALRAFRFRVIWHWLTGASAPQPEKRITWERMDASLIDGYPYPRILHPWPEQRFDAITQGRSPVR